MKRFAVSCIMVLSLLMAVSASADVITFDLTVPNPAISPYPAPYANVTVDRTSPTTAAITFTGLNTGGFHYLFGTNGAIALNVNAGSFSFVVNSVTSPGSGTIANLTAGGAAQENGFGVFNFTLDNFDGMQHADSAIEVTLTDLSGIWADAASVLIANAGGSTAAAHIFVWDGAFSDGKLSDALATGYAANGTESVPEPGTILLLGAGLLGVAVYSRKGVAVYSRKRVKA